MKKTLAEQVQALKDAEKQAWERLVSATVKEMNAILKRMGKKELTESSLFIDDYCRAVKEKTPLNMCNDYAKVYAVVHWYEYIQKLTDRWIKLSAELTKVSTAINEEK